MKSASQIRLAAALVTLAATAGAQSADTVPPGVVHWAPSVRTTAPAFTPRGTALFDNGPIITGTGAGFGGADVSTIEATSSLFGSNCNNAVPFRVADDFSVPAGQVWDLSSMTFWSYQTGSTTTSTYTGAFVRIWSGASGPGAGSSVFAGDVTINRLVSSSFSNIYRVTATTLTNNQRPIMQLEVDMSWAPSLPAGDYWVEVGLTGSLASGPWVGPVTPRPATANARQFNGQTNTWGAVVDNVTFGVEIPFILEGSSCDISVTNSTPGAPVPASGSGGTGAAWPTTLPGSPTSLPVTVGCAVNCIDKVTLNNLTHSWSGDVHVLLEDPNGVQHNLLVRPGFTGTGFGNASPFSGGSYVLVDVSDPSAPSVPSSGAISGGTYRKTFGPAAAAATLDTPLRQISGPAGTWTLRIYDWAGGDSGLIDGFTLDFNACASAVSYCVAKVNSQGCTPAIGFSGAPSATATSGFTVTASNILSTTQGMLFYSQFGPASVPFQGGTRCVATPTRRTVVQGSGGTPISGADCTGAYSIDMNAFAQGLGGGSPGTFLLVPGTQVNCQWWSRDPGDANNAGLTDALQYFVGP